MQDELSTVSVLIFVYKKENNDNKTNLYDNCSSVTNSNLKYWLARWANPFCNGLAQSKME